MLRAIFSKSSVNKKDEIQSCSMDPLMHKAATSGDVGVLQRITDGETSAYSTDLLIHNTREGNNILHLAAQFKKIDFFKEVISSFAEASPPLLWEKNKMGNTPLHIAARVGCSELVKFLINQAQMLHVVQQADDKELGPIYAESYKKLLGETNFKKHTALHVAARYGHTDVVKLLIEADTQLCCATNSENESPLFLATCKGFYETALAILDVPAILPSFQGVNGVTALHVAAAQKHEGGKDAKIKKSSDIVESIVSKHPHMTKLADEIGWTPLHYAAFKGNLDAVELLMGADKTVSHIMDKFGMTALHVAAYKGHIEVMKHLIDDQPDTCECFNAKGQTILHVAVVGAQSDVVKYILEIPELRKLKDHTDGEEYTPLQLAARIMGKDHNITRMRTTEPNHGLSFVFDNFLRENIDIQLIQVQEPVKNEANAEEMSTEGRNQGRSFGVPAFQEQIRRDFKIFKKSADDEFESAEDRGLLGLILPVKNPILLQKKDKEAGKSGIPNDSALAVSNFNLVIATLIATVTFSSALNPPGGFEDDGKAILRDNTNFRWFQQFNMATFTLSMTVLVFEYMVAVSTSKISKFLLQFNASGPLVLASLWGMVLAFSLGRMTTMDKKPKTTSIDWLISAATSLYIIIPLALIYLKGWMMKRGRIRRMRLID